MPWALLMHVVHKTKLDLHYMDSMSKSNPVAVDIFFPVEQFVLGLTTTWLRTS